MVIGNLHVSSKHYLAIESFANWQFDRLNKFSFLGVSPRQVKRAKGVRKGDMIIIYVSKPKSAFADVRRVIADGTYHERRACDYELPLSDAIKTEALVTPPTETWLPYKDIAPKLSFVGNPPRNAAMRQSFRVLSTGDAEKLINAIKAKAQQEQTS
jgi:hypothetical protein